MSLLELGMALENGVEAGAFPQEAVDAFEEHVNMGGLVKDHMPAEDFDRCAGEDGELMGGELRDCIDQHVDELEKNGDQKGLEEFMQDLNAVKISKDDAGAGLQTVLEATGADRDEWAAHLWHAADVCYEHLHPDFGEEGTADIPATAGSALAQIATALKRAGK